MPCSDLCFILALQLAAPVHVQAPLALAPCARAENFDGEIQALGPLQPPDECQAQRLAFRPWQWSDRLDVERVLEQPRVGNRDPELALALHAQIMGQHSDDARGGECFPGALFCPGPARRVLLTVTKQNEG